MKRVAAAMIMTAFLGACQTDLANLKLPDIMQPAQTPASAPQQAAAPAAAQVTAVATPADPLAPGKIVIALSHPGLYGAYCCWKIQFVAAENVTGFRPFITDRMTADNSLSAELWAGRYRVRLILEDRVEYDGWIEIGAGETKVLYADIGFAGETYTVETGSDAERRLRETGQPKREFRILQTFGPLTVTFGGGLEGRYFGPRRGGEPAGHGKLTVYQVDTKVAEIPDSRVTDSGTFEGTPQFTDGRTVDVDWTVNDGVPDGALTTFPDGQTFVGSYQGTEPSSGTLTYSDGTAWTGPVGNRTPAGIGTVTLPDGSKIANAPGLDTASFDGAYPCTSATGKAGTCYFIDGEKIASEAAYNARREEARKANEAAIAEMEQAQFAEIARLAEEAAKADKATQAAPPPPPPAPAAPQIDGCKYVEGKFVADGGLSKLTIQASGRGHLWQQTYGGTEVYTMDIDFTYTSTRDSMDFNYEPAVYKNAGGAVMRRINVPGGTAKCTYDGRSLTINGKVYSK